MWVLPNSGHRKPHVGFSYCPWSENIEFLATAPRPHIVPVILAGSLCSPPLTIISIYALSDRIFRYQLRYPILQELVFFEKNTRV